MTSKVLYYDGDTESTQPQMCFLRRSLCEIYEIFQRGSFGAGDIKLSSNETRRDQIDGGRRNRRRGKQKELKFICHESIPLSQLLRLLQQHARFEQQQQHRKLIVRLTCPEHGRQHVFESDKLFSFFLFECQGEKCYFAALNSYFTDESTLHLLVCAKSFTVNGVIGACQVLNFYLWQVWNSVTKIRVGDSLLQCWCRSSYSMFGNLSILLPVQLGGWAWNACSIRGRICPLILLPFVSSPPPRTLNRDRFLVYHPDFCRDAAFKYCLSTSKDTQKRVLIPSIALNIERCFEVIFVFINGKDGFPSFFTSRKYSPSVYTRARNIMVNPSTEFQATDSSLYLYSGFFCWPWRMRGEWVEWGANRLEDCPFPSRLWPFQCLKASRM